MITIAQQINQLSAGTMAGLINDLRYTAIDNARNEFASFADETSGAAYPCWQDAWTAYENSKQPKFTPAGDGAFVMIS